MKAPTHVAVVGGSGSGKTWLAERMVEALAPCAARVSLDDFYQDLSNQSVTERARVNFDDPAAIDWTGLQSVMGALREEETLALPVYDFATHTRKKEPRLFAPPAIVIWDGLWLLHHEWLREKFALTVFVDCGADERFRRRAHRDVRERGRQADSVREQFYSQVEPMHGRFVEPQRHHADHIVASPVGRTDLDNLLSKLA